MPLVSILVVTYNGFPHVARFLASLRRTTDVPHEVIVVDNASRWPTRLLLVVHAWARRLQIVTLLGRNTFFSPGVNTAFRVSDQRSRYVLLLNPDIVIRDPRWLARMIAAHKRGATSLGYVEGGPWSRADGYCLLVDRDLFEVAGGLSDEFHWWWAVTRLQADLLRQGHDVQAVVHHEDALHHVGGGSGTPPLHAKGMSVADTEVRNWFDGRRVSVLDAL